MHTFLISHVATIMFYSKLHTFLTVCAVQAAALFVDKKVPYWPIEVSRMAASGPVALNVFRAGALALGAPIAMDAAWSGPVVLLWAALIIIAVVDDVTSHTLHMFGVALLGASAWWQASRRGDDVGQILLVAVVLYGVRLVLKALTVWWYELGGANFSLGRAFTQDAVLSVKSHSLALMYGDRKFKSAYTKAAFYAGGVLQWCCFAVLSLLY